MSQEDEGEIHNFNRIGNRDPNEAATDLSFLQKRNAQTLEAQGLAGGKNKHEEIQCRICLSPEEDPIDNPIINPCQCIGSVKYIHLECIREWLEGKKHKKETPYVNSYIWRGLECEICKAFY